MATETDRIESDVLIAAPVERVWELVTSPEHVGRWFGDAGAEIDLRPGGALSFSWREHGTVHGRVEAVERPRRFAYRWHYAREVRDEATTANSTLVEFTLTAEGDATRVTVVESGFDGLDLDAAARAERIAGNTRGWTAELGELVSHAEAVAAA